MTEVEKYFLDRCVKVCVNELPVTDTPYMYRHPDLAELATKAKEEGKELFYYKPKDPRRPKGKMIESEPIYKYECRTVMSEEKYNELKKKASMSIYVDTNESKQKSEDE